jgi:hypothetical protein
MVNSPYYFGPPVLGDLVYRFCYCNEIPFSTLSLENSKDDLYAFVLRPALEFTTENCVKYDCCCCWADRLLQLRQKERLSPLKYF